MDETKYNAIIGYYAAKMCRIWSTMEYDEIYNELWCHGRSAIKKYDPMRGSLSNYMHVYFQYKSGYHLRKLVDPIVGSGLRAQDMPVDIEPEMMLEIDLRKTLQEEPDLAYALAPSKAGYARAKGVSEEQCRRKYQLALERASWAATKNMDY